MESIGFHSYSLTLTFVTTRGAAPPVRRGHRKGCLPVRLFAGECLARNAGVPVHERAVRVVLPRPNMKPIKRRKFEAIGNIKQIKELPHKLRWAGVRMQGIPRVD